MKFTQFITDVLHRYLGIYVFLLKKLITTKKHLYKPANLNLLHRKTQQKLGCLCESIIKSDPLPNPCIKSCSKKIHNQNDQQQKLHKNGKEVEEHSFYKEERDFNTKKQRWW